MKQKINISPKQVDSINGLVVKNASVNRPDITGMDKELEGLHRINILGTCVNAINMEQTLNAFDHWLINRKQTYICVAAAHSLMECLISKDLQNIFNASGLTTPDGMSIVWLLQLQGQQHVRRVYGPDLVSKTCERYLDKGYRHFFYGGAPGVAENMAERLSRKHPNLQIAGVLAPPFSNPILETNLEDIERINNSKPDIIWAGFSSPKQELWMNTHREKFSAPLLVGVGAAFDFLSGNKKQAPRWIQSVGMEWIFRLKTEPRRLWPRYSQYPKFVFMAFAQYFGLTRFD